MPATAKPTIPPLHTVAPTKTLSPTPTPNRFQTLGLPEAREAVRKGRELIREALTSEAIESYDEAIKIDPSYAYAYVARGGTHFLTPNGTWQSKTMKRLSSWNLVTPERTSHERKCIG